MKYSLQYNLICSSKGDNLSRQERFALFNLIVASCTLAVFAALIPMFGESRAQSAFALLAVLGLGPFFFRRRDEEVTGDERDQAIHLRATQITFIIFWLLFVGALNTLYFLGAHTRDLLIQLVWFGTAAMLICHSTTVLILYRRS
jgi:hypothetical protein